MTQRRPGLSRALAALAYGDYRRFAASLLLTSLGAQLLQTAILWQVYELTGSALLLGLTGVARALPHIVLSLAGGVIADRVDRVRLVQTGQVANALLVAALAGATLTGDVQTWHLYAVTFLNSAFMALTQPARTALIPRLVPAGALVNAVALNSTIQQLSQILGPAVAGIAIATVDLGAAYVLNATLYVVAMLALLRIRASTNAEHTTDTPWQSLIDGLRFIRQRPVIVSLLSLDVAQTVFASYRALLPIIATGLGVGVSGFGLLSAAPGVGAVAGATLLLALGDMRYKGLYTVFGVLGYCVALVMLALSPWFAMALVAAGILGAANSLQAIPRNSAILTISPDALRGRVEAFRTTLAGGGPPIGETASGALAAAVGVPLALLLGAATCAAFVTGVGLWRKELRDPHLGWAAEEPAPTTSQR